ncbi:MAG: ABC transporter substrate-binding protein [Rhodobacteraceae bacterium]|nr:ABC transporter substrate-binding protein [Paracoccaceae bacterium]
MRSVTLKVGFLPLVDAAPLIMAEEMGFAAEEGIALDLMPSPSWSALRDMLSFGRVDAAHMLAPVPVAGALGLGGGGAALEAVSVLSVNGNVIGVSPQLAEKIRAGGHGFGFDDAEAAGRALIGASGEALRIGVPFPFSMHAELVFYWLTALGLPAPQNVQIRTVPPPLMADAVAAGEVDAFCVGEPWGSMAVENGVGELLLPCSAIWAFSPEKVLAMRADWAANEPALRGRMIRAVWRAQRWLAEPGSVMLAAEILSRPAYLDLSAEMIERALTGRIVIDGRGTTRKVESFVTFFDGAASFPWRSQGAWIARAMASRLGLDRGEAMRKGAAVFRPDYFREALHGTTADLPGASAKIEGANPSESAVASEHGTVILKRDSFFDGHIFDPNEAL